ncbi:hypothetical protein ACLKMH_15555 [Psychromonas sp. KJ10-10]|uniref:hypothetical protein n=1 Tax=Psychromonas sp. KJ10-10 TaxID=3391823 RepID=UPI0039B3DA39
MKSFKFIDIDEDLLNWENGKGLIDSLIRIESDIHKYNKNYQELISKINIDEINENKNAFKIAQDEMLQLLNVNKDEFTTTDYEELKRLSANSYKASNKLVTDLINLNNLKDSSNIEMNKAESLLSGLENTMLSFANELTNLQIKKRNQAGPKALTAKMQAQINKATKIIEEHAIKFPQELNKECSANNIKSRLDEEIKAKLNLRSLTTAIKYRNYALKNLDFHIPD